ncbi:UDP-glucose dehydrogenase family protein [Hydrogenophaga sp. OTU3427]|uniref:UDP-glucose dehydrogenase family protein n=1 Tax=Hydrogenophaga sp. OTU3427 TaxID=3043856 RepID=UPI00313ADDA0
MNILMIGSGYVGLVTGTCLAHKGHHVVCIDNDAAKLAKLKTGEAPFYEPGLSELMRQSIDAGKLQFEGSVRAGLDRLPADGAAPTLIFIAVGTPMGEDGSADLKYVLAVAREIGQQLDRPAIVINKSTVPVGTAEMVQGAVAWQLFQRKTFIDFEVASNPEFLKEGAAIGDFMQPDRVILGCASATAATQLRALYAPFTERPEQLIQVGVKEAELIKYAANAMLATRISFMNEMANICDRSGIDIDQVRVGVGSDQRIGPAFLRAGCGYGGSCFPKDVQALARIAQSVGVEPLVLQGVEARNRQQKQYLHKKVVDRFGRNLNGHHFAVWGLAFKPGTDDMREAPSIELIQALIASGATVHAHDPVAADVAREVFDEVISAGSLVLADSPLEAAAQADAVLLVTEWPEYREVDWTALHARMKTPVVLDGRNHLDHAQLRALGFTVTGIGR